MEKKSINTSLFTWEIIGVFFIIIVGTFLHFIYEWFGYSDLIGLFAPVNESVWEHLKLGFWAPVLWGGIEFAFVNKRVNNFFLAKLSGVLALETMVVLVFYTYTAFTGRSIVAIDISSFILGVLICQAVTLLVYRKTKSSSVLFITGVTGLTFIAFAFMLFTYVTPRLGIFQDSRNGTFGPVKISIEE